MHAFNTSTNEAEADGSLLVRDSLIYVVSSRLAWANSVAGGDGGGSGGD